SRVITSAAALSIGRIVSSRSAFHLASKSRLSCSAFAISARTCWIVSDKSSANVIYGSPLVKLTDRRLYTMRSAGLTAAIPQDLGFSGGNGDLARSHLD